MYGLAYVLLPPRYASIQSALDEALAPFRRGGEEDLSRSMLAFHDETQELEELHRSCAAIDGGRIAWKSGGVDTSFHLDFGKLKRHLSAYNLTRFEGLLAELEPDFDRFVALLTKFDRRDPGTGRYGRWLNPLGKWDWWELGGRFNGIITGSQRAASDHQYISSGESGGRTILGNVVRSLGAIPSSAEAEIELNVELVETLWRELIVSSSNRLPLAIVLPPGSGPDEGRWFDNLEWHAIGPATRQQLQAPEGANYRQLVERAYVRFRDHVAAGIAYHF